MTRNLKFDNEMKQLSIGVYNGKEKYIPKDWIKIGHQDSQTGFHGEAFYKNGVVEFPRNRILWDSRYL